MDHLPAVLRELFEQVGSLVGLQTSFAAFVLLQLATVLVAGIFRKLKSGSVRLAVSFGVGVLWCYVLYGVSNTITIFAVSFFFYIVTVHRLVPAYVSMILGVSVLSGFHIYRMLTDYMGWALDVTGPLMLLTAKFTSLAYDLEDGCKFKNNIELSVQEHTAQSRRRTCLVTKPTLFQYYAFLFDYLGILAGPIFHMREYLEFIEFEGDFKGLNHVSFFKIISERLVYALIIGGMFSFAGTYPQLSFDYINSTEYLSSNLLLRLFYLNLITTASRLRYYFAWYMADVSCLVAGIGYNPSQRDKFSRGQNAIISKVDFANCQSEAMGHWNISISKWLRENIYLRALEFSPVPKVLSKTGVSIGHRQFATLLTRFVSAFWHGFYPGYYMCFFSSVLQFEADSIARKYIKPWFLKQNGSNAPHWVYTLVGRIHTSICLNYYGASFLVLSKEAAINVWSSVYYCVHIVNVATILFVPVLFKSRGIVQERFEQQKTKDM